MKLVIGLGNPGEKYQKTRHNLGQNIVLKILSDKNLSLKSYPKLSAQLTEIGQGSAEKILIGITNEYMNNSGIAVKKITDYFKIKPEDIYIIHDELDIPVGDYKIQFDRGAAGHNGIRSTIEYLHTQAFHRIRVGVGKPLDNTPVENYVLLPFTQQEKELIDPTITKVASEIEKNLGF
jgi:PTH1 family peptidyl-tRNA hydrolase